MHKRIIRLMHFHEVRAWYFMIGADLFRRCNTKRCFASACIWL